MTAPVRKPAAVPDRPAPTPPASSAAARRDRPPRRADLGYDVKLTASLIDAAQTHIGVPYKYAGSTPRGFDCSGLISYVFDQSGIDLPRTAIEQSRVGTWIPLDEALPGDLLFFGPDRNKAEHVGIVVSTQDEPLTMIHASTSKGVISTIVERSKYWLGRLRFARRVVATSAGR